jgi:esterase
MPGPALLWKTAPLPLSPGSGRHGLRPIVQALYWTGSFMFRPFPTPSRGRLHKPRAPLASPARPSVALHYQDIGHGLPERPVVMVHGLGAALDDFSAVAGKIAKRRRVILYDLRGHGRSFDPGIGYTVAQMVDDCCALIARLGARQIDLVGHCMGGKVAMRTAELFPHLVHSVFIEDVGPLALADVSPQEQARVACEVRFLRQLKPLYQNQTEFVEALLPLLEGDRSAALAFANKVGREAYDGLYNTRRAAVIKELWLDFKACDTCAFLKRYKGPVLFLRGKEGSRYFSDQNVRYIRSLQPPIPMIEIAGSGHLIHAKRPDLWLTEFFKFQAFAASRSIRRRHPGAAALSVRGGARR